MSVAKLPKEAILIASFMLTPTDVDCMCASFFLFFIVLLMVGIVRDWASCAAAQGGHLDCMKYIHEHGGHW